MTTGAAPPPDDVEPEAQVIDDEPDVACYLVEHPWVPILTEPSHEGKEVGRLRRGDLVCCERAAADGRNRWLRLPPAAEIFTVPLGQRCRRRQRGDSDGSDDASPAAGEEGEAAEGSEDEETAAFEDSSFKVRKSGEGGYVVGQHCVLGTLLRHVGPPLSANESTALDLPKGLSQKEIDEVISSTKNNEELDEEVDLPDEAKIWTRAQLEDFLVHGTRPRWRFAPEHRDLGLSGPMGDEQVEEVLRTAVEWVTRADAILVCCGAGMTVDSGLPSVQSSSRGPLAWRGLRSLDLRYEDMCSARWFKEDPRLAWGFWLHICKTYRDSELHAGYEIVRGWMEDAARGGFVFSSTFEGFWASCGWPVERLLERHGALHYLQCSEPCCDDTWPLPNDLGLSEDPETGRADGDLPCCPRCGAVARPNVELFGGDGAFRGQHVWEQWARYDAWACKQRQDDGLGKSLAVVLELGCSPGSTARRFAEDQTNHLGRMVRLIRVNPQHVAVAPSFEGEAVAIPLGALDALMRMERLRGVAPSTSFICQDANGNGAEVVARSDASAGHVFRRALASMEASDWGEDFALRAGNILSERDEKPQALADPVPASMQVKARDADIPAVKLWGQGMSFGGRNARMLARLEAVKSLLTELCDEFGSKEYQAKLEACEDRAMVVNLVRDVHYKVLPNHGISMNPEKGSGEASKRVLAMQAFLQSGKFEAEIGAGLGWSVHLSGYSRLAQLPAAKAKNIPAAGANARAIVVADAKQAAESRWTSSYRPPKVLWIAGTWNKWSPAEMKWDGNSFVEELTISKSGWESFQVLVMGRWESSFYPSVRDGNPYIEYKLLGPDAKGHGRNFTIGRHARDVMRPGEKVKVIVDVDAKGVAKKVTWKREDTQGGHFKPQYTGVQLMGMEEQIVGQWQYGTRPNIYSITKALDGPGFRFEGPHANGRVSGSLKPEGGWLQAELLNSNGMLVGSIRLSYLKEKGGDTMISNFKNASKTEWGKDIGAKRVPEDK